MTDYIQYDIVCENVSGWGASLSSPAQRPPRFGVVARAAGPVAGQGRDRPDDREDQKRFASGDARLPGAQRTQRRNYRRGRHTRRPHDRFCPWAGRQHRRLFRLHSKEWQMLEHPSQSGGVGLRIARAADGVEREADSDQPSDRPVRDSVAEEVKQDPSGDHGSEGDGLRLACSRSVKRKTGDSDAGNLQYISHKD
jgi:hypothetical protein